MTTTSPAVAFEGSKILILDFGSQYTQVIARRVRECSVYSQIVRYDTPAAELAAMGAKGIILSGGPASVYAENAPQPDPALFDLGLPVLGICYGLQLMFFHLGGKVEASKQTRIRPGRLAGRGGGLPAVQGVAGEARRLEQPRRQGEHLPPGFRTVARTENSDFSAVENPCHGGCTGCSFTRKSRTPRAARTSSRISSTASAAANGIGRWARSSSRPAPKSARRSATERVILGLSGGVDSSVAAMLVAPGDRRSTDCVSSSTTAFARKRGRGGAAAFRR